MSLMSPFVLLFILKSYCNNKFPLLGDDTKHVVCDRRKIFTARKRVEIFSPQMDVSLAKPDAQYTEAGSETINILDTKVHCEDLTTTCFVESGNMGKSTWKVPRPLAFQEVRLMEIADFMGRPYLLEPPFEWTSSNGVNTTINGSGSGYSPATLLLANNNWLHKIEGFNLFRATFVLRVEINAYPFQAGRLLLHYLPNYANFNATDPGYAKRTNYSLVTKIQHPHRELDCRQTSMELEVPWIAPAPYWDKKNQVYDWGTIFVDVLSVLAFGANSNTKPVQVSCFGYWKDIELSAPMVPQMNTHSELKDKPISSILKTTSALASKFSDVPVIGEYAEPVSWVTNALAGIASFFGWSKPLLNVEPSVVTRQKHRYFATSDGPSTAYPTGLITDNRLAVYDKSSINSEDEMSFNFLKKIPLLVLNSSNSYAPYQWNVMDTTGTQEFTGSIGISPGDGHDHTFSYNAGAHTYHVRYLAPYQYLATKFMYWRGSFNLTLKFVKTIYHTGRLSITWTPYHNTSTVPDTTTGYFSLRTVVDIREQDEITLNLPYMVSEPWLYTSASRDVTGKIGYNSGYLDIRVLNELRCPETCASTVDILMFLTPGDDFELSTPCSDTDYFPGIFSPQMDTSSNLVHKGIGDAKVIPASLEIDQYTVGERFTGVKQLINRLIQFIPITTASPWSTFYNFVLYPHFFGTAGIAATSTGVLSTPNYVADPLSFTAGMYAYFRGSVDIAFTTGDETAPVCGGLYNGVLKVGSSGSSALPYATNYTAVGTPNVAGSYAINYNQITTVAIVPTDTTDGIVYFHCPYQNKYPISLVTFFEGTTATLWTEPSFPETNLSLNSNTTFGTKSCLYRNAGDDFQFSFFIGCPPLLVSKT